MTGKFNNMRQDEGFTITEIVVALFLMTLGLLSLAAVMSTVVNRQNFSQTLTSNTNLSATKLEEIKGMQYDNISSLTENFGEIEGFPEYKRETIVTPNDGDTLKVVEVKVTSSGGQVVSIQTVVAR